MSLMITRSKQAATMSLPARYAPSNPKPAASRVPGMGKAFKGYDSPYKGMSGQGRNRPAVDLGAAYPQMAKTASGPA